MIFGNKFPLRGKYLSFVLAALVFTALVLWAWEENPFVTTFQSVQEWYRTPYAGFVVGSVNSSALLYPRKKNTTAETYSNYSINNEIVTDAAPPVVAPAGFAPTTISKRSKISQNSVSSTRTSGCDYANGGWVPDSNRPLYSGFKCKRWLSAMWACRLTQRADFSYEGYRWLPKDCNVPPFEQSAFLKRMQDKTIAFVGDSLGRQQFQSLMCMATGGKESPQVKDVGKEYGLVKARGAVRPDGWAYRFTSTNTTILYYWSASLSDLLPLNISDPASEIAMHLDRPPAFLRKYLNLFDVLVLNTGHHWNRGKIRANKWVMYTDGRPSELTNVKDISKAKDFTIHSIVKWLDSQLPSHPRLKAFFRTISPRHFLNGEWDTGGSCDNTTPLMRGSRVIQNGSSDPVVESALRGTQVKILDITAISQLRDEGHISHYSIKGTSKAYDCLHWCLPGIPDTWNEILIAQI